MLGVWSHSTGWARKCLKLRVKPFRIVTALLFAAAVSVALAACGSNETAVVAPQDAAAPAVTAVETTGPAAPAPTDIPAGTAADSDEMARVELKPVDDAAMAEVLQTEAGAEPEQDPAAETATAALRTSYSDYGFSLKLDLGADVRAAGWTEPDPSVTQGIIAFSYGGVNANLVWGPPQDRTALTFLADTYNILRASQPSVAFESISDGDILISDQEGVYGGFKAVDNSGSSIGGGLIGA